MGALALPKSKAGHVTSTLNSYGFGALGCATDGGRPMLAGSAAISRRPTAPLDWGQFLLAGIRLSPE